MQRTDDNPDPPRPSLAEWRRSAPRGRPKRRGSRCVVALSGAGGQGTAKNHLGELVSCDRTAARVSARARTHRWLGTTAIWPPSCGGDGPFEGRPWREWRSEPERVRAIWWMP